MLSNYSNQLPGGKLHKVKQTINLGGKEYAIISVKSKTLGWSYIAGIPTAYRFGWLTGTIVFLLTADALILIVGLIYAFVLARRDALPWWRLMEAMNYSQVSGGFTHMLNRMSVEVFKTIKNNGDLTLKQAALLDILSANVVDKLLSDSYVTTEQIQSECETVGIPHNAGCYILCRASGDKPARAALFDALFAAIGKRGVFASSPTEDNAVYLLIIPGGKLVAYDNVYGFVSDIVKENSSLLCTFGSECSNLVDLRQRYHETLDAFYALQHEAGAPAIVVASHDQNRSYYMEYPIDFEQQLLERIGSGNSQGVTAAFEQLRRHIPDSADTVVSTLFNAQLRATTSRLLSAFKYNVQQIAALSETLNSGSPRQLAEHAEKICLSIITANPRKSTSTCDYKAMLAYVQENYPDYSLCMDSFRNIFGYSANQINNTFAEHTGKSFAAYLEKTRLENACKLLISGVGVNETAEAVGYAGSHSFRRAFKRYYGVTPSEFRAN